VFAARPVQIGGGFLDQRHAAREDGIEQLAAGEPVRHAHAFVLRLFRCHKSVPDVLDTNTCFTMAMFMSA
jgi:hypothetical protein